MFLKCFYKEKSMTCKTNGRGGIRTLDTVSRISVFKTDALNRSATLPSPYFNNF